MPCSLRYIMLIGIFIRQIYAWISKYVYVSIQRQHRLQGALKLSGEHVPAMMDNMHNVVSSKVESREHIKHRI